MNHIENDRLIQFVLGILDEQDNAIISDHLSTCESCRAEAKSVEQAVRIMGSIEIPVNAKRPALIHNQRKPMHSVYKLAAGLAVGFLLGYTLGQSSNSVPPTVVPQRIMHEAIQGPFSGHNSCPPVDLKVPGEYLQSPVR
jgi:anti-sigma factor RsiW